MRHTSTVWRKTRLVMMAGAGGFIALLCLLIWGSGLMMSIRLRLNDVYYTPAPTTNTVVIIAADDASLARYGRTPAQWSRQVYADLARRLENVGARVVALDFLLSQPQPEDEAVAAAFAALRQNEARTRIVFAEAGVNTVSAPPSGNRLMFAERLSLTPILQSIPDYRGYVNALPDTDGVLRRLPSQLQIDDRREMSFSTAIYLAYLRIPSQALDQVVQTEGSELLLTPQRRVPVDALGLWQPYYFADTGNAFVVVPLNDVLDGKVSPELFRDKIVLVGLMNTTGTLDEYLVPSSLSGSLMAGVEIQAHAVESLLQGKIIRPLPTLAQAALLVGLAMLASLAYALPRWTAKLALAGGLLLVYIVAASVVFSLTQFSVSLLDGFIALLLPVLASIGVDITLETRRRQQTEFLLGSLQRIAQQRLRLPQAAEYILEDIERVVGESDPTLYIRDPFDEGRSTRFRRGQPPQDETAIQTDSLAYRHRAVRALTRSDGQTLVPLMWQGRQLGLLHIAHRAKRLDRTTEAVLGRLAENLAPNLDNMLLYDEVQRQRTLLDSVFAESPTGLALLDAEGRVLRSNQHLLALLEMPLNEVEQRPLADVLTLKSNGGVSLYERLTAGLQARSAFAEEELKLGGHYVRVVLAPLQSYELWTAILADITPLVEFSNLKTRMLRIASHDLKNPLARIKGFVELILITSKTLEERERKYLELVNAAGNEMLRIIEDILDLERLRSGKPMMNDVNLSQVVREVCARHQPDLIHKQQTLGIDIADEHITVRADAAQLSQAVNNFVGNAIKYTPEGGKVGVRLYSREGMARFEVEDTGYGIPEKAQANIFSEFYRAKAEGTLHIPGTGLGLSLVKSVIESHGGTVGFTSTEGVGSTFYFVMPEKRP